jgi:RHS repeat-associated protein
VTVTYIRHHAYGTTRAGNTANLNTDRTFTGQKQDGTGLLYYNARYYDPALGTFISPDTLVPDPGLVLDYNRYMYVRGNPLRYTDPSGHYTNDEIMQHFGCSDWACVEGFFNDGGSYAGMWGWLYMLQMAEDGWSVESTKVTGNGQYTVWGQFQRNAEGRINILAKGIRGPGLNHTFDALLSESDFAQYPQGASFGYYQVSGSSGERYVKSVNQQTLNCRRTDCTGRALNAVSTGSSFVAAGCAYFGAVPCVAVATRVGAASGTFATLRAVFKAADTDATAVDVIDAVITGASTAAGVLNHPYTTPFISSLQWTYDEYTSRAMR